MYYEANESVEIKVTCEAGGAELLKALGMRLVKVLGPNRDDPKCQYRLQFERNRWKHNRRRPSRQQSPK